MNPGKLKFVRFKDWSSERSPSSVCESPTGDEDYQTKYKLSVVSISKSVGRGFKGVYARIKSLRKSFNFSSAANQPPKKPISRKKILDPQGPFLQKWNKFFLISCVIAVSLDPLFFYIPVINSKEICLSLDRPLEITACVLRTFIDIFYILHIIFQFRTGFIAPYSRVFGRGELVGDPSAIGKRYLSSYFIVDVLSILPLPQLSVLAIIPKINRPISLVTKELLKYVIISQYIPRFLRVYPLYKAVTQTSGILTETAWAGAAINLFLYLLASHVVGALWYLFSIERQDQCWLDACNKRPGECDYKRLYCGKKPELSYRFINDSCQVVEFDDIKDLNTFNFGIVIDALKSGVLESIDFRRKFFYCFWWGLRNVSSLGQNLKTSTFVGEIIFAIFISIFGLILFSSLIGNMQKYLQSTTVRVEEMRVRRQDAKHWMSHRMLPEKLRERIRRYEEYKWQETRGVDEESLICNLPKDLKRDIKHHFFLDLLTRVPVFGKMDEQLLDALCDRLKPVLYTEKSCIIREGDPVDAMLFIMRGNLSTVTTNGGRTGFFNLVGLKAGDFCGEELLTWALDPNSSPSLPSSSRTVETLTDVEAFALMADDLKLVASQYRRLHSKQLQSTFKFYSPHWRAWAAGFLQAAWRRHCKRKLDKSLQEAEGRLKETFANDVPAGTSTSLGATIYASKFATRALLALRTTDAHTQRTRLSPRLLPLLPPKPAEPDFSAEAPTQ